MPVFVDGQGPLDFVLDTRTGSTRTSRTPAAEDLTACEVDLRHAARVGIDMDGLLGLDFLKPFRATPDFQRARC